MFVAFNGILTNNQYPINGIIFETGDSVTDTLHDKLERDAGADPGMVHLVLFNP